MPTANEPVNDLRQSSVTKENYHTKAKDFMRAKAALDGTGGSWGFMIGCRQIKHRHGDIFPATPTEWGAWMAYLRRLGLKKLIRVAEGLGYLMVPSRWPHEFDTGSSASVEEMDGAAYVEKVYRLEKSLREKAPLPKLPDLMGDLA